VTVDHRAGDAVVRHQCVRTGATVTVILRPRPGGWPPPHSSSPMLATVTGTAVKPDGFVKRRSHPGRLPTMTDALGRCASVMVGSLPG
jgi:hypothetical protein